MIGSGDVKIMNCSAIGFNHIKNSLPCQDYSFSYSFKDKTFIAISDGHGGRQYIRSQEGSKYAVISAFRTLIMLDSKKIDLEINEELIKQIKLNILCSWNHLVEQDYGNLPFSDDELKDLTEDEKDNLITKPELAYGCTLHACLIINNLALVISIGDGGIFAFNKENLVELSVDKEENVANITDSLCNEEAYQDLSVKVYDISSFDAVIAVSDGLVNPYQSYSNFKESFVFPLLETLKKKDGIYEVRHFVKELGASKGIGDDVSLSLYYKEQDNDLDGSFSRTKED